MGKGHNSNWFGGWATEALTTRVEVYNSECSHIRENAEGKVGPGWKLVEARIVVTSKNIRMG